MKSVLAVQARNRLHLFAGSAAELNSKYPRRAQLHIRGPRKASLCGERRSGGISEARRLRQDERNAARDDVVYNCA